MIVEVELFIDTAIESCLPNAITLQELSEETGKDQRLVALDTLINTTLQQCHPCQAAKAPQND